MAFAAILAAVSLQAAVEGCSPIDAQVAVNLALEARKARDPAGAQARLAPVIAGCGPETDAGYLTRTLAADTAAGAGDWKAVRPLLASMGDRPGPLSARVAFLRLAADKALGDAAAFAADRAALLAANDAGLAARGRRVESFAAGPYTVAAYEAPVTQGAFKRLLEFVAAPSDPAAYPVTVMLTDDTGVDKVAAELAAKPGASAPAGRVYFVDLYTCGLHTTLSQRTVPPGAPPPYAEVKAAVAQALAAPPNPARAEPAGAAMASGPCSGAQWLAPGLGLARDRTSPPAG